MQLRELETFRIVMATLNMTEAAAQVKLSPAAVSLQIKRLSDHLGADLFTRIGPKLLPTLAAKRLQEHSDRLSHVLQAIHREFRPEIKTDEKPFILAAGMTTLTYQLFNPLNDLRKKFPNTNIQIRLGTTETIIKDLECKHIDLGIVSLPLQAPNIRLIPLFKEEMMVLLNARSAKFSGRTISLKQLADLPLILYPTGATRNIIDRMAERHGLSLRVIMEVDNTEAIKKLVEAGFGASILPKNALKNSALIRKFNIADERLYRQIAFATAQSAYPRKITSAIMKYLSKKLTGGDPHITDCTFFSSSLEDRSTALDT